MANSVSVCWKFEADNGAKCSVAFDSSTWRLSIQGDAYPWMIKSVLEWIENAKDQLKRTKEKE